MPHSRTDSPAYLGLVPSPFITFHEAWNHSEWGILFRHPFGLPELVEWDNLTRELDGVVLSPSADVITWRLEPSGQFSTSSLYLLLSRGAIVSHFKEVWHARVPPRVRVFLWQLIRGKLPCSEQVAKRLGPSNGECALCDALEDCNHIFFSCSLARFMWAGVREVLQCAWKPVGVGDFLIISRGFSGPMRRLVWFTFAAQCWALWIVR
jgi:hypothetical protein